MIKKILIVDDSSTNNLLCELLLKEDGYEVVVSEDGEEALIMVEKENPNLILLDIMMPKLDGFNVLKKLKNQQETSKIPIIVLSARNDRKSINQAKELGACDYIIKPIQIKDLSNRVKKILLH